MLENRYKTNLASMEKWEKIYKENVSTIISKSQQIIDCQNIPIIL